MKMLQWMIMAPSIYRVSIISLLAIVVSAGLFAVHPNAVSAANEQVIVTWKTNSYVPPGYTGKALPTTRSSITARVSVLSGGKLINLSGQTIYWYLDGEYVDGGVGKSSVTVVPIGVAPNTVSLRVSLPDFENELYESITVPIVRPQIALEVPTPNAKISAGITAIAYPYFFNAALKALRFGWSLNGTDPKNAENPNRLTITGDLLTESGSQVTIGASVQNPAKYGEAAQRVLRFIMN